MDPVRRLILFNLGIIPAVDWLDRLTFAEIERISQKDKTNSNKMFLNIEFPQVMDMDLPIAVVYYESFGDTVVLPPESNDIVSLPDPDTGWYHFFSCVANPNINDSVPN